MTAQTIIMTVKTDHNSGELAYFFGEHPNMRSSMDGIHSGQLAAHDLLEHVNGLDSIGSIDDELEALSGVWYVRGQSGRINNYYSAEENIASDVTNLARYYMNGVNFKTPVPKTRACDKYVFDDTIDCILDFAKESVHHELEADYCKD